MKERAIEFYRAISLVLGAMAIPMVFMALILPNDFGFIIGLVIGCVVLYLIRDRKETLKK